MGIWRKWGDRGNGEIQLKNPKTPKPQNPTPSFLLL